MQLVSEKGGVQAAKQFISKDGGTYRYEVLWESYRLDLSVEAYAMHISKSLITDEISKK